MSAIVLLNVSKRYGSVQALSGLSLEIPKGVICGVIGPNGSGKTTTFGVLAGLLRADAGRIDLFGEGPFDATRHAGRIGLMPQDSVPSPFASLHSTLCFYAKLQGLSTSAAETQADRLLETVDLADRASSRFGELSHGMRRRFTVAQALIGNPELVLLDEPTSGLDPESVVEMRKLFSALRGTATVLISSHILSELQSLCDYAVFMEGGRATRHGPMREMTEADRTIRIQLTRQPNLEALRNLLSGASFDWEPPALSVRLAGKRLIEDCIAVLLRALLDDGVGILGLEAGESLEATYLASRNRAERHRS